MLDTNLHKHNTDTSLQEGATDLERKRKEITLENDGKINVHIYDEWTSYKKDNPE